MSKYKYLSVGADAKTVKGAKFGVLTAILYLSPAQTAGGRTVCPFASEGCKAVCLTTAGRGAFPNVQAARIRKTKEFFADPMEFAKNIKEDIRLLVKEAAAKGFVPAVRLNGTSDIMWGQYGILQEFPDVQFYSYTKWPASKYQKLEPNEHVTFSLSEEPRSLLRSEEWAKRGVNTAVVFSGGLPATYLGRPVIDGDLSDLRFTDPKGVIVGLKAKGQARGTVDGKGFVKLGVAA